MASSELAQKLQRRLLRDGSTSEAPPAEEDDSLALEPAGSETSPEDPAEEDPAEDRGALNAAADPELSAKLTRRQDINAGAAPPRLAQVFNPYTEFKEFTRRQIKDMERLFRL